jgi:hypothetical protein
MSWPQVALIYILITRGRQYFPARFSYYSYIHYLNCSSKATRRWIWGWWSGSSGRALSSNPSVTKKKEIKKCSPIINPCLKKNQRRWIWGWMCVTVLWVSHGGKLQGQDSEGIRDDWSHQQVIELCPHWPLLHTPTALHRESAPISLGCFLSSVHSSTSHLLHALCPYVLRFCPSAPAQQVIRVL